MTKTVFLGLRIAPVLYERIEQGANDRGMNVSEFVRHMITVFFDHNGDNGRHENDSTPQRAP